VRGSEMHDINSALRKALMSAYRPFYSSCICIYCNILDLQDAST